MKNQISKLYSAVSAPVAATRDVLAARLESVRDTASLLYNRTMYHIGYGQETLKDIVENVAKEEEKEPQQQTEEEEEAVLELTKDGTRVKEFRITRDMKRNNTKIIMNKITQHVEMRTKVVYSLEADIYRGAGEIKAYSKTLSTPPGMFTSLQEIREYIRM